MKRLREEICRLGIRNACKAPLGGGEGGEGLRSFGRRGGGGRGQACELFRASVPESMPAGSTATPISPQTL